MRYRVAIHATEDKALTKIRAAIQDHGAALDDRSQDADIREIDVTTSLR